MNPLTFNVPKRFLKNEDGRTQTPESLNIRDGLVSLAIQRGIRFGVLTIITLITLLCYGCPHYRVWQQGLEGKASLKKAEQTRKITIEEAQAIKESSIFKAEAEVIRAQGAADANKIIAEGLGGPEGYLRYLFIQTLEHRVGDTIYIPTEAGLPILEARNR